MSHKPRVALAGAVQSTVIAAETIASFPGLDFVGIAGLEPADPTKISGYADLAKVAEELNTEYAAFVDINSDRTLETFRQWNLDYFFVIGISQLVSEDVIRSARIGSIGYHPTALPFGRGRAPVAWLVLGQAPGGSTLFALESGADTGGILAQVTFDVGPRMDASDVSNLCYDTLKQALDELLPQLARREWNPVEQAGELATYLGKRVPGDGLIDWLSPASDVDALIRASAPPHPGAYCYNNGRRLRVLASEGPVTDSRYSGVPGKVLHSEGESIDVQCLPGIVRIRTIVDDNKDPVKLREGAMLRTRVEDELHSIRRQIAELQNEVEALRDLVTGHQI